MEVVVRAEQDKIVFKTELDQHRVNCSNLDTMETTDVADFGGLNMVLSVWSEKAQRAEPIDQLTARFGSCKALEKFLQHQTCSEDLVRPVKSVLKFVDLRSCSIGITAKRKRPYARINEQAHGLRARSAL